MKKIFYSNRWDRYVYNIAIKLIYFSESSGLCVGVGGESSSISFQIGIGSSSDIVIFVEYSINWEIIDFGS